MYKVLLLCRDNSLLSPLAGAYFKKFAGTLAEVYCAGVELEKQTPEVMSFLKKENFDRDKDLQHKISDLRHVDFDYILTLDRVSEAASHHFPSKSIKYHFRYDELPLSETVVELADSVFKKLSDKLKKDMHAFIKEHFNPAKAS